MKVVFKWIGIVLGSLVGLIIVAGLVLFLIGNARLNKVYSFEPSNLTIPTDEVSIANGKHRVESLCAGCHGPDLSGVEGWFNAPPIGMIDSANLTSGEGGAGQKFTSDEDWVRAIRHGIDPQGKPLFMPAVSSTAYLSDEDLASIIAYVKSVPPVDHKVKERYFTPMARILVAAGVLGKLPAEGVSHDIHVSAPERGVSAEYGEYLVNTHDCRVCHGPDLNGGPFPDPTITKISPNLTPGGELDFWTEEDFINTIRTGKTPSGHELDPYFMPWNYINLFYDDELKAVFMYLQSLPKLEQYTE
ncbi:MAG: c-type cytochrome [Anaerolineales bacterium]|nr:c-type cytochrome [Anaerolineales bacterium]